MDNLAFDWSFEIDDMIKLTSIPTTHHLPALLAKGCNCLCECVRNSIQRFTNRVRVCEFSDIPFLSIILARDKPALVHPNRIQCAVFPLFHDASLIVCLISIYLHSGNINYKFF